MNRAIITISEEGLISIPRDVQMSILEIAHLFELSYTRIKRTIRTIEKEGLIQQVESNSYVVENSKLVCEYYGLEMIVAVVFQAQSSKAKLFKEWIIERVLIPSNTKAISLNINQVNECWN